MQEESEEKEKKEQPKEELLNNEQTGNVEPKKKQSNADYETHIDRTDSRENVQKGIDYMNNILAKGIPYTDEEFPASHASFCSAEELPHKRSANFENNWSRVTDLAEDVDLFKEGPRPDDI